MWANEFRLFSCLGISGGGAVTSLGLDDNLDGVFSYDIGIESPGNGFEVGRVDSLKEPYACSNASFSALVSPETSRDSCAPASVPLFEQQIKSKTRKAFAGLYTNSIIWFEYVQERLSR